MTGRWIVGIDESDPAKDALRWAIEHAPARGVGLTLVNAFHVPSVMTLFSAKRGFGVDELGLEATAAHELDELVETYRHTGVSIEPRVVEGEAQHELVDAAADADVLIVGRRGGGGLRHHLLGSVSRYCATHSSAPVVVVSPGWSPQPSASIVVGFDGSDHAKAALRWAMAFAADDAEITAVAALEVAPWLDQELTRSRMPDEVAAEEAQVNALIDEVDPDGRVARSVVLHSPKQALSEALSGADLVVVGSRGRGGIAAGLLGSVSTWLLHDAPCPVAVIP